MKLLTIALTLPLLGKSVLALNAAEWRSQCIYFLMTDRFARTDGSTTAPCDVGQRGYCGGSWKGIIDHLAYIQGMGFTAIWITPIVEQIPQTTTEGTGFHGYWPQNIYSVNSHFGTADDIRALSKALHDRGMYLMMDGVANHMGFNGPGASNGFSTFTPFNSASYFHSYCPINNYNDQWQVENCYLRDSVVSLTDLNTQSSAVRGIWYDWVKDLVANYSVDGLRIDTAKHVEKDFWSGYTQAAGVYSVGEILHGDPAYTCPYQGYMDGVMNYPIYYQLVNAFKSSSGSISSLSNMISSVASKCKDPTLLGNFIENHDNPRFPSYTSDISQAKSVIAYVFLTDGIPIIYSGQEQHLSGGADPYNREALWLSGYSTNSELYKFIAMTNKIRRLAISKDLNYLPARNNPFYTDSNTIAMKKGSGGSNVITVLTNSGSNAGSYTLNLNSHGYSSGSSLIELYTCSSVQVDSNGNLPVPMSSGLPRVLVPSAWVPGSGLCGASSTTSLATPTVTSPSPGTCAPSTAIPVIFKERVATSYGENIFLSGSIDQLGNWDTSKAVALSASGYTSSNPVWSVKLDLHAGTYFQYKFIKKGQDGSVMWESDPNRSYTLPSGCVETAISIADSWR
ncbi:acid alpha-amylase [Aspergillus udagawae]|uniref:alpha-amylase n=1 Tax=Aspergillus udagawae TaxID=91492 RepID=A0ABQ1BE85_9EURO|nr:acid alpha-amylase [Aspergillus udagawae]GFF99759.1 acid alpha-amylase [Aspergillus udagawae]